MILQMSTYHPDSNVNGREALFLSFLSKDKSQFLSHHS